MLHDPEALQRILTEGADAGLTDRQMGALKLHCQGKTLAQIGVALGISTPMAWRHVHKGREKLDAYADSGVRENAEWLGHAVRADVEERVVSTWQHGDEEEYAVNDYWRRATLQHGA